MASQLMSSLERQAETRYTQLQALVESQADDITGLHSNIDTMLAVLTSMQEGQAAAGGSAVTLRLP